MKAPLSVFFIIIMIKLDGPRLVDWCCFAHHLLRKAQWIASSRTDGAPSVHLIRLILLLLTAHWIPSRQVSLYSIFFFSTHPVSSRLYSSRMNVFQSKYCCTSSWKREGQTDKCVRTHWHMNKPDTHSHLYSCNRAEPLSSMWD